MQKEELGMDENRNPEEELRLLGGKKEKCHSLSNRIRTGNCATEWHPGFYVQNLLRLGLEKA